jgi:hypothetical protein
MNSQLKTLAVGVFAGMIGAVVGSAAIAGAILSGEWAVLLAAVPHSLLLVAIVTTWLTAAAFLTEEEAEALEVSQPPVHEAPGARRAA